MRVVRSLFLLLLLALAVGGAGTLARTPAPPAPPPAPHAGAPTPTPTLPPGCVRAWDVVPSANIPVRSNALMAVTALSSTDIWAVGYYQASLPSSRRTLTLHWDGVAWSVVYSPNIGATAVLYGVAALGPNDVWAVGTYNNGGAAPPQTLTLHWDGTQWSVIPSPNPGPASILYTVVMLAPNNVWAGGIFYGGPRGAVTMHWNGIQWSHISNPIVNTVATVKAFVVVSATDLWAIGTTDGNGALIMHWDGTQWQVVSTSLSLYSQLMGAVAVASNDVWAVGQDWGGSAYRTLITHWDGSQWSIVPSPNVGPLDNTLYAVTALAADDVWAVGTYIGGGQYRTLTLHWDGLLWQVVSSPNIPRTSNYLYGLTADSGGTMWAVGGSVEETGQTLVLRYAPTCLTVTPTPTITSTPTITPTPSRTALPPGSPTALPCGAVTWLEEGFESGTLGPFVSNTPVCNPGGCGWRSVTSAAHTGLYAAYVSDYAFESLQYLTTANPLLIPTNASQVKMEFWNRFAFEQNNYDGGTLFYSTNYGQTWDQIPASSFQVGGYNGYISLSNPYLAGYAGWVNSSNETFIQNIVDLTAFRGQPLLLRFAFCSDNAIGAPGWWLDDVRITFINVCSTPTPCPACPTATPTGSPTLVLPPSATRTATYTATPTTCPVQFVDVPPGSPFYPYVRCLACAGIVSGYLCGGPNEPCPGSYFRPGTNVTRGQTSKIVSNAAGFADPIPSTQQTFEDVPPGSTFHEVIERLAARGVIDGYPCGGVGEPCVAPGNRPYFRPNNSVTRGQLAKIVSGAAGWTETPTGQTFEDAPPGSTFYLYVERLAARGGISGYPCGGVGEPCIPPDNRPYYRPNNPATRGQMSKIAVVAFLPTCPPGAAGSRR